MLLAFEWRNANTFSTGIARRHAACLSCSARIDFQDKFEALSEAYNNRSKNLEQIFDELLKLCRTLSEEETRHVRENLSEEELAIFDILTRPSPDLSGRK